MNTKQPLDEYLMHATLIRCFMVASMLPSHPLGLKTVPARVIVLIIMCAKPEKRLSLHFEKYISMLQLISAGMCFQCCFEGSIVFTRITRILISLSLEIPCMCCGLYWTLPTPTATRHFQFFFLCLFHFVSNTLVMFQKAESCVETSANSYVLFCIF